MSKEINIVFLDDEQGILNSIDRLFVNASFGIFTTSDYKEALNIIDRENVKVVLSDHRMPNIKGTEFLKMVKAKNENVVRILFTGYAEFSSAEEAINVAEVYRFISKPWDKDELRHTIDQAMEHYDLVLENKSLLEATQQKNQELEELNKKLQYMYDKQKEFTSTVSHELRTPLASIKSSVDLVLSGETGELNEDQINFLSKSKDNVDRLSRLISDILDLAKMEDGKMRLRFELNDLGIIVGDAVEGYGPVCQEQGLFIKSDIASRLPKVICDVDKIHQVLNNLLGNAMKFTEKGGITVSCHHKPDSNIVRVCVKDTGPGIAAKDIEKLFQKFQQLGDSRQHVGGTGLGLSICKEIIDCHGGKIWCESELGRGTSFCFVLPVEERRKH